MRLLATIPVVLALSACATTTPAKPDSAAVETAIRQRVDSLLYRYSNNDQPGVIAMLDPERFVILGSGPAEIIRTPEQLRGLMTRDFEQWGKASFSDVRDVDIRAEGNLATAYLVMTWSVGNAGPTLPIRLCTTWHKVEGEWLLTQSANAPLQQ